MGKNPMSARSQVVLFRVALLAAIFAPTVSFSPLASGGLTASQFRPQCQRQLLYRCHTTQKPSLLFLRQASEEAQTAEETSASDKKEAAVDAGDNTEDEWKATEDPTTGRVYYWNTKTREVSWYKPARKIKGLARALLEDGLFFSEYSGTESTEDPDRVRTEEELAAKRERRERRRDAAQQRAQRMQSYLTDTEAAREQRNLARSPTKLVTDELAAPKQPRLQDSVASLLQSARGEQPSLQDKERLAFVAWLDKAYDELADQEDPTGLSIPGLFLRQDVSRGDVADFDMRLKLARDPQKALETATERALKRGSEAAARALAEAQGNVQQTAQEAIVEAARSGAKLGEVAAEEGKGLWSRLFGKQETAAPEPPTALSAAQTEVAPETEQEQEQQADAAGGSLYPDGAFEYSVAGQSGGQPKENQDTTLLKQIDADTALYAVFDGHGPGGATVSQFIAERLRDSLSQVAEGRKAEGWGREETQRRVKGAFLDADNALSEALQEYCGLEFDGSTGCAVIRNGRDILISFVGDSSCVVGNNGFAKRLTQDHAPMKAEERYRIEASGGMVAAFPDEPPPEISGKARVFIADQMFPGLAVSRAFGDLVAKTVGVIAEPECVDYTARGDEVLIVGSDGVWDVVTNEEAVGICMQHYDKRDAVLATADLVDTARKRWEAFQQEFVEEGGNRESFSIDDISAVTVFL